ncbi:hypothetical protein K435DRAFT_785315 [Dendrothele bispora CBS 962.96]|uniref:Uncharacterized protein n=1 Tax=Dendrothele bispora (strain CBS 962.96) TaxID=1314807 RepID=A0A4S8KXP3_DENBC|nr:hypothetical protein K435DRAFT_785315 [Dendrothele bispora CBS 962.96]
MPTTSPLIIIDDELAASKPNLFTFISPESAGTLQWFTNTDVHPFYGQTITDNSGTDLNSQAGFNLSFFGTGATIMGFTTCDFSDQCHLKVALDDGDEQTITPTEFDPNRVILDMQNLPEGNHNIHVNASDAGLFMVVDYALIYPGPNTDVSKQLLYVNHSDPAINYTIGNWLKRGSGADTTRGTVTRGDTMEFSFSGSNLTAYSVFNQTTGGNISLAVTVDGDLPQQITASSTLTEAATALGGYDDQVELYHPLFNFPLDDDVGAHTVSIQLLSLSESQVFDFRGFMYNPSFQFLNSETSIVPDKVTGNGTGGNGSGSGSGSGSNGNSGNNDYSGGQNGSKLSGGAIAGIVIGTLLVIGLAVAAGIIFFRRKRRVYTAPPSEMQTSPLSPFPNTRSYDPGNNVHSSPTASSTQDGSSNVTPFMKTYVPANASATSDDGFRTSPKMSSPPTTAAFDSFAPQPVDQPVSRLLSPQPVAQTPVTQQIIGEANNREENRPPLSQTQIVEMIERLNNRVEELHRPPAYSSNNGTMV